MAYKDWETMVFSELACLDLDLKVEEYRREHPGDEGPVALKDLKFSEKEMEVITQHIPENVYHGDVMEWKVAATMNDTGMGKSGFFGCVIETSSGEPKEAAVAFRASGDPTDPESLINDYIRSDVGLLNSTKTPQEAAIDAFFAKEEISDLLQSYDNLAMTGHSLGGALADYATIRAEYLRRKGIMDLHVTQCVNNDGPGHSKKFIDYYKDEIEAVKDIMVHNEWSPIGGQLWNISGTERYIETDDKYKIGGNYALRGFAQHDRGAVIYNEDGSLQTSEAYARFCNTIDLGKESRMIDGTMYWSGIIPFSDGLIVLEVIFTIKYTLRLVVRDYVCEKIIEAWDDFWDTVAGKRKKKELTLDQKVAEECALNPGFTIYPTAFVSLASQASGMMANLEELKKAVEKAKEKDTFNSTFISKGTLAIKNTHGSSDLAYINQQINSAYIKVCSIHGALSSCFGQSSALQNTVSGMVNYLGSTGIGILEIEAEAQSRVSQW